MDARYFWLGMTVTAAIVGLLLTTIVGIFLTRRELRRSRTAGDIFLTSLTTEVRRRAHEGALRGLGISIERGSTASVRILGLSPEQAPKRAADPEGHQLEPRDPRPQNKPWTN
jgi:hypothetical protein